MSDQRTTFALTELSVHELCTIISELRVGINDAEKERNALHARVAELEAQIAAHERVCAGIWVPSEHSGHLTPAKMWFDTMFDAVHALTNLGHTTHTLKPKLPTSSGEG